MRHALILLLLALVVMEPAWAQESCTDDVRAWAEGNTAFVIHEGALYNCCPTRFDYEVTLEGDRIVVVETEILEEPCYCVCCIDLDCEIADVPAGTYVLEFHWYDYETYEWQVWFLDVEVPGQTLGSGDPYVARSTHSDCYGYAGVNEEPQETWGSIKALYR